MINHNRDAKKHKPGKFRRVRCYDLCSKCGHEISKDDDKKNQLNAKGKCFNCGYINIWFAKRGFAPGEGSTKRINRNK